MTVKLKGRHSASRARENTPGGGIRAAAAFALGVTALAAGETRAQGFTLEALTRMSGFFFAGEFPVVRAGLPVRAKFDGKRLFAVADGTRLMMFVFRSSNCWLRERTATARSAIDCLDANPGRAIDHPLGPGVFIPVLFVTPASQPRSSMPPITELTLRRRNGNTTLADYAPGGDRRSGFWIRLNLDAEVSKGNMLAAPAALVICVPAREPACYDPAALLINLDDTPPEPTPPSAPGPATPSAAPPRSAAAGNPAPPAGPPPGGLIARAKPEAGR
jgi:hypothetical protein